MASDIFLKIGDIKGESMDDKHKDEIDVMSFSWGVSQTGTLATGGGAGAGKAQFQDLHISTNMSKASPLLFKACATGEHIKEATLSGRKAGGKGSSDYLVIKLNDVLVSSYQTAGASGGSDPVDSLSLSYAKIEFSYKPQNPDGSLGGAVTAGWDLKANKAV